MEDDHLEVWPIEWNSQRGKRVFPYDAFVSHAGGDRAAEFVEHLRSLGATYGTTDLKQWAMLNGFLPC